MVKVYSFWRLPFSILYCSFIWNAAASIPSVVQTDIIQNKCVANVNNKQILKEIGSIWNTSDPCIKEACTKNENGVPTVKPIQEYCSVKCKDEYDKIILPGQCCGQCVKTKCKHYNNYYKVGETWRSNDTCEIYTCERKGVETEITKFRKSCPPIDPSCPKSDIYINDCCPQCRQTSEPSTFDYETENLYESHPCKRECMLNAAPMTCKYQFTIEWYETMSKACYNCPRNITDCFRPHCIISDGIGRSVEVINRKMPGPAIEVCLNDTIVVDVKNSLLGESTTIHWHGLHQRETPYMDGVPHISQCPIQPHTTFRYHFKADRPGTHFWHSHTGMQRGDGSFGALIIRKPKELEVHSRVYDYDLSEHMMIIQDWAHVPGVSLFSSHHHSDGSNKPPNILVNGIGRYYDRDIKKSLLNKLLESNIDIAEEYDLMQSVLNATNDTVEFDEGKGNDTIPDEVYKLLEARKLIKLFANETSKLPLYKFSVKKGYRYRFRVINAEFLNCPIAISIDNHTLSVINTDGYDVKAVEVSSLVTYAGERFDFVVNANQNVGNYWIRFKGLMDCDERFTSAHQAAILHYIGADNTEPEGLPTYDHDTTGVELNTLNEGPGKYDSITVAELVSLETEDSWTQKINPDYKFYVYYDFYSKDNPHFHVPDLYGINQTDKKLFTPQLNHISMKMPPLPLMQSRYDIDESLFCNASSLEAKGIDCRKEFCECSHVIRVHLGAVVEMVLVDEGRTYDANHPFHLHGNAFRVVGMDRIANNIGIEEIRAMDDAGLLTRNLKNAPIKDTVTIPDGGYTIIRFKADNPGFWLFHCHIEFHAEIGMALVLKVGENDQMLSPPKGFPTCYNYMPKITMDDRSGAPVRITYNIRLTYFLLLMLLGLSKFLL